jgi:hypothetical protein
MLRATMECFEKGLAPTIANRARLLGMRRQSVWGFDKKHPDFLEWQDHQLRMLASSHWGPVKYRMAMTAMQGGGSTAHAEQFCRMEAGHYFRAGDGLPPITGQPVWNLNLLVPRPETPGQVSAPGSGSSATPASLVPRPPLANIPTVAIR